MITISIIPPEIIQNYDHLLLSKPIPKFKDDAESLKNIYEWIRSTYKRKIENIPNGIYKFTILEKQFMGLYERAIAKEKELKETTGNIGKEPFYFIQWPNKYGRRIFERLRKAKY